MSNAVVIRDALKQSDERYLSQIADVLPEHADPKRMVRTLLTSFAKTPKLLQCSQESVWKAAIDCATLGLEPDVLGRAYLIPYGDECQLVIGYKGLIDLAMRSGQVAMIASDNVYQNDSFIYRQGTDPVLEHEPLLNGDRGPVYCTYAFCKTKDGGFYSTVMTTNEVNAIRDRTRKGGGNIWKSDYLEMAKKTAIKRLAKMLPLSPEFHDAVARDNESVGFDPIKPVAVEFTIPTEETGAQELDDVNID